MALNRRINMNENILQETLKSTKEDKKGRKAKDAPKQLREPFQNLENQAQDFSVVPDLTTKKPVEIKNVFPTVHKSFGFSLYVPPDRSDPFDYGEYSLRVFEYMGYLENFAFVRDDFMALQFDINDKMRYILVNWLVQVHQRFNLIQEALFICVQLIDRYISIKTIFRADLQCVAITCLLLASKYEEQMIPAIKDFIHVTDYSCTALQIREMECTVLNALDYNLSPPISLQFLRRLTRICEITQMTHNLAKYFIEICLTDSRMSTYRPSILAASSIYLACAVFDQFEFHNIIEAVSGYPFSELEPSMRRIPLIIKRNRDLGLKALYNKYSFKAMGGVSILTQLKTDMFQNFTYFFP